MKKRVFSLLLALTLLLCALPLPVHAAANEITVYNWGQYISDGTDESLDVIQAFEEETGIKVNYLTFDSNESMYTKLKTGGTTFDVIIPSDYDRQADLRGYARAAGLRQHPELRVH